MQIVTSVQCLLVCRVKFIHIARFLYDVAHDRSARSLIPLWISLEDYSDFTCEVEHPSEAEMERVLCFTLALCTLVYSHQLKE